MLSRSFKSSGQGATRLARQHAVSTRRAFVTSSIRKADLVQDMYLRELKNYKAPQLKPNDAEGHVLKFKAPQAPKSPEESDLAKDLSAYETQKVEMEGQAEEGGSAAEHDWFEEPDYEDDKKDAHH